MPGLSLACMGGFDLLSETQAGNFLRQDALFKAMN
jgi:hypothetical protein